MPPLSHPIDFLTKNALCTRANSRFANCVEALTHRPSQSDLFFSLLSLNPSSAAKQGEKKKQNKTKNELDMEYDERDIAFDIIWKGV